MRYSIVVVITALLIGLLMQAPQLLQMQSPLYRGVPLQLNSDEDVYLARLEESLAGRPEQSSEAIVGDPELLGSQAGLFERVEGAIFRPFGLRAATVEQIMDFVVPPAIFLALIIFFSLCGFRRWPGFFGACAFVLIELYSLNRPVQPRGSFLLLLLAFSAIIVGLERRWVAGCIGGAILGILIGVYFWAWTFGWLWLVLLFLCAVIEWLWRGSRDALRRALLLCLFGFAGVLAAIPALFELRLIMRHPLYADAVFRSGMHAGRLPESWPYSILFTVMMLGVVFTWWNKPWRDRTAYAVVTVLTAFIAIHQQILHGTVFNFVSHYLFALVVAAICVVLLWHVAASPSAIAQKPALFCSMMAALVYLGAIAYDGRYVFSQWTVRASRFSEQHFATLLPALDAIPRVTILSDGATEQFIAGSTKHDVVYTLYLKNVLMSHREIADRYCATVLPVAAEERFLEHASHIYPDAVGAFKDDPDVRQREIQTVAAACAAADLDPAALLKRFGVQYVLWDERRQTGWDLKRLKVPLAKFASGSGWSLWSLNAVSPP
ncbi:hypothetical protein HYW84_02160 [Candidatus Peregrinibacteria bacterium]|nr:hypothetical protein [Candidatus Peregrinibacteria bacterium]